MLLKKIKLISFLMLLPIFTCFSQGKKHLKPIPQSIYSFNEPINLNSNYSINKKLNLKSYSFVKIDIEDIENGYFTIPFCDLKNIPSSYIYDTYSKIQDNLNIKKSFFKIADLYNNPHSNK
jgi:hypothetical protein